jgi:hypothetical protein
MGGSIGDGFLENDISRGGGGGVARGGVAPIVGVKRGGGRLPPRVPPSSGGFSIGGGGIPGGVLYGQQAVGGANPAGGGPGPSGGGGGGTVQPWDLSAEEMLPAAVALKQQADALLAASNYVAAEHAYDHALRFVEYEVGLALPGVRFVARTILGVID